MLEKGPLSLEDMVKKADLIVDAYVDKILGHRLRNPALTSSYNTDVLLSVNRILKGSLAGKRIVTSYSGGTVGQFEVIAQQDPPMRAGERFIFFLDPDSRPGLPTYGIPGASRYYRIGVWNGAFAVQDGRIQVSPKAYSTLRHHQDTDLEDFVTSIQQVVH